MQYLSLEKKLKSGTLPLDRYLQQLQEIVLDDNETIKKKAVTKQEKRRLAQAKIREHIVKKEISDLERSAL